MRYRQTRRRDLRNFDLAQIASAHALHGLVGEQELVSCRPEGRVGSRVEAKRRALVPGEGAYRRAAYKAFELALGARGLTLQRPGRELRGCCVRRGV